MMTYIKTGRSGQLVSESITFTPVPITEDQIGADVPNLTIGGDLTLGGVITLSASAGTIVSAQVTVGGEVLDDEGGFTYVVPSFATASSEIAVSGTISVAADGDTATSTRPAQTWVIPLVTQSNMHGLATGSDATPWPANSYFLDHTDNTLFTPTAQQNIPNPLDATGGPYTLAKYFAIDFLAANPGDSIIFIPAADSGSGFASNEWNRGNVLYDQCVRLTNIAIDENPGAVVRAILVQGFENDAVLQMDPDDFTHALTEFVAAIREDLKTASRQTSIVFSELADDFVGVNADRIAIRDAALASVDLITHSAIASSRTPTVLDTIDNTHFNLAGLIELGARHAAALDVADAAKVDADELEVTHVASDSADFLSGGAQSSHTFTDVAGAPGTTGFIVLSQRGPNTADADTVIVNGQAATRFGRIDSGIGRFDISIWRAENLQASNDIAVTLTAATDRIGLVLWSVDGNVSHTEVFFSEFSTDATQLSETLDYVPKGGVVISSAAGYVSNNPNWTWYNVDESVQEANASLNFVFGAADRKFESTHRFQTVAVEFEAAFAYAQMVSAILAPLKR